MLLAEEENECVRRSGKDVCHSVNVISLDMS